MCRKPVGGDLIVGSHHLTTFFRKYGRPVPFAFRAAVYKPAGLCVKQRRSTSPPHDNHAVMLDESWRYYSERIDALQKHEVPVKPATGDELLTKPRREVCLVRLSSLFEFFEQMAPGSVQPTPHSTHLEA